MVDPTLLQHIKAAVEKILNDELVIAPTDTLYALTANAESDIAVTKIFAAKKRSQEMALPVMVRDIRQASEFAYISDTARILAEKYWPGALTLIVRLRRTHKLSKHAVNINQTVAIRAPDNYIFQELLQLTKLPLIGTSANISGQPYIPDISETKKIFGNLVSFAIESSDSDFTQISEPPLPSTIVDCTGDSPVLVRQGSIIIPPLGIL